MTERGTIEITPTAAETEQLQRDLQILRDAGAPDNTTAVLEAVRTAASLVDEPDERSGT